MTRQGSESISYGRFETAASFAKKKKTKSLRIPEYRGPKLLGYEMQALCARMGLGAQLQMMLRAGLPTS
jgi:hypothetical protein